MLKSAALNASPKNSFVDHIAPLASLLNIPLLISDEKNFELTAKYYPEVELRFVPDIELKLFEIANEFDSIYSCDYWSAAQKLAFQLHTKKPPKLIFCPHGQSDKGYGSSFLTPYKDQEVVLLYGSLMQEMLQDLNLWNQIPAHSFVGNFRLRYFEKHKVRLRSIADREIFSHLNPKNRTLLYAPTWNDLEGSSTLSLYGEKLLAELPPHWNLCIKLHPNLATYEPHHYERLHNWARKKENFLLIEEFPLIYPLLDRFDCYLGDYSSIGYDYLLFNKPMFFLQKQHVKKPKLHSCGALLDPADNFYEAIEKGLITPDRYKSEQEALYSRAFAKDGTL